MDTLKSFDNSDLDAFQITASALGISEYQLFIKSYQDWYGDSPHSELIDAQFGRYLHTMELPFFVRHYARHYLGSHHEVIQSFQEGHRRDKRANTLTFGMIILLL